MFRLLRTVVAVSAFLALAGLARASPLITLNTQGDWQAALGAPTITPVSNYYDALGAHYGTLGTDFIQVTPELMALDNAQSGGLGDGLLMYWGDPTSDLDQVATWEYTYPSDPDLRGTTLTLSVNTPGVPPLAPGILSVSLTLNDLAGGWVSWDWNVGPGGPIFPGMPYTVVIDPTVLAPQSGSTSFALAPGGFNPAIATSIQADELSVGAAGWAAFPPVPVVGGAKPWNYWTNLQVSIPEPSIVVMLLSLAGMGALGYAWRRRRVR